MFVLRVVCKGYVAGQLPRLYTLSMRLCGRHGKTRDLSDPGSRKFLSNYGNFLSESSKTVVFNKNKTSFVLKMMKQSVFWQFWSKNQSSICVKCLNCWFFVGYFAEIIINSKDGSRKETNFLHVCKQNVFRKLLSDPNSSHYHYLTSQ